MKSRAGGPNDPRASDEPVQRSIISTQSQQSPATHHASVTSAANIMNEHFQAEDDVMFHDLIDSGLLRTSKDVNPSSDELTFLRRSTSTAYTPAFAESTSATNFVFGEPNMVDIDMGFDPYFDQLSGIGVDLGNFGSMPAATPGIPLSQGYIEDENISSKLVPPYLENKSMSPAIYSYPRGNISSGGALASDIIKHLGLDDTNENQSLIKTTIARGYNIRDVFLAGLGAIGKQDRFRQMPLPNPLKTTITMDRMSTIEAYISIALALGFSVEEVGSEKFESKFNQPRALKDSDSDAIITSSKNIPQDLRPTMAQILYPHFPWIDLIPFPILRENIIMKMTTEPLLANPVDLKDDLFLRNGLFCWRSKEKGVSGQPWDMRCWEAEPWFLRKWAVLLDGESGQMWQQTQWWRSMRGMAAMKGTEGTP
jgi:hypothetical protein